MQIAESSYPQPLPHQETPPPSQPPPPFNLTQPLSPVLEPASEHMPFSPFLSPYPEMRLQPLPSSPGARGAPPPLPPPLQQQSRGAPAPLQFYQTCELPGASSPEPEHPAPGQYPADGTPQSSMDGPDCPRSSGLQEAPSGYDPLALSEFPGLFDCEMLEAVDPQHSGYVLVN